MLNSTKLHLATQCLPWRLPWSVWYSQVWQSLVHSQIPCNTTFFKTFSLFLVVTDVLLCETVWAFMLLQWCSWHLGHGGKSLSYWCPIFWDSAVISSSGVKISMQNSSCFSMNILTLADETTILSQNVRLQPSYGSAPHPQTAETSVGWLLKS